MRCPMGRERNYFPARFASIVSQILAATSGPPRLAIARIPVGQVTLISVRLPSITSMPTNSSPRSRSAGPRVAQISRSRSERSVACAAPPRTMLERRSSGAGTRLTAPAYLPSTRMMRLSPCFTAGRNRCTTQGSRKVVELVLGPTLEAEFELEQERGQFVPNVTTATKVVVSNQQGQTLLSGVFNTAGLVTQAANDIDATTFFVEQQYRDFLGREADDSGLGYWSNEIAQCNGDAACVQRSRVNTSGAFFLSIEFQETGYMLYRFNKASFGAMPRRNQFLVDMQAAAQGVVVGQDGWQRVLEDNKRRAAETWVAREEFRQRYASLS